MRTQQRWTVLILLGVLCIGLLMTQAAPVLAAEKSLVWERFDVDIQVNARTAPSMSPNIKPSALSAAPSPLAIATSQRRNLAYHPIGR
jgi:hypothetical protein